MLNCGKRGNSARYDDILLNISLPQYPKPRLSKPDIIGGDLTGIPQNGSIFRICIFIEDAHRIECILFANHIAVKLQIEALFDEYLIRRFYGQKIFMCKINKTHGRLLLCK